MWQIYALMALDMSRERAREAEAERLAHLAQTWRADELRRHPSPAGRPGPGRRAVAGGLRWVESGAASLAEAARSAASRVEGRVA